MTAEALADIVDAPTGFQMQSWSNGDGGSRSWVPMEDGPGANVWRPRKTRDDAVHKCIEWTGMIAIPAMRVVDLSTGDVVWQDSRHYPDAGPSILPHWETGIRSRVAAAYAAERERDAAILSPAPPADPAPAPVDDGALFTMGELDV